VNPAVHIAVAGALVLVTLAVLVWVVVAYRLDLRADRADITPTDVRVEQRPDPDDLAEWAASLRDDAA